VDCPKCGTWNPDDKTVCWRCQTELPRPEQKKKRRQVSSLTWIWVIMTILVILMIVQTCMAMQG